MARSDHNWVLWVPKDKVVKTNQVSRKKTVRPLTDSGLRSFSSWLTSHTWEENLQIDDPSQKCDLLCKTIQQHLDVHLPTRNIRFHATDKPWITAEIKAVIKQRQQAWHQNNRPLWSHVKTRVMHAISSAKRHYYQNKVCHLKTNDPAGWHRQIKFDCAICIEILIININAMRKSSLPC